MKLRWFRFSLRSLFVLVTIFSCWLGYELNWIRQRRLAFDDAARFSRAGITEEPYSGSHPHTIGRRQAPGLLWLFGEPGYAEFWLFFPTHENIFDRTLTPLEQAEVARTESLFPEAKVVYSFYTQGGYGWHLDMIPPRKPSRTRDPHPDSE